MLQPGDISEETEESQCCSLKIFAEEEGYEADSESNPDDSETKNEGKCQLSEYAKLSLWHSLLVF